MTYRVYFLQSSELSYGHWSPWNCCSPHYETEGDAMARYRSKLAMYFRQKVRLVYGVFWYARRPHGKRGDILPKERIKVLKQKTMVPKPPFVFQGASQ